MPEALTESFCERCGTRYEFKAPTRLNPLRKSRGFVSGLKNYILSQDALGDAIGDAMRSEQDRLASAQLDAFHSSFNFCIDCRQYTCVQCWNDAAGRCRTCAPIAGTDDLAERIAANLTVAGPPVALDAAIATAEGPAAPADDPERGLGVDAWPSADLDEFQEPAWPMRELEPEPVFTVEAEAEETPEVESEVEPEPALAFGVEAGAPADDEAQTEQEPELVAAFEVEPEPEPEPEPVLAEAPEVESEPEPVAAFAAERDETPEVLPEPEPVAAFAEEPQAEPEAEPELEAEPEPQPIPVLAWDSDAEFELIPFPAAAIEEPSIAFAEAPQLTVEEAPATWAPEAAEREEPEPAVAEAETPLTWAAAPEIASVELEPEPAFEAAVAEELTPAAVAEELTPAAAEPEPQPEPQPEPVAAVAEPAAAPEAEPLPTPAPAPEPLRPAAFDAQPDWREVPAAAAPPIPLIRDTPQPADDRIAASVTPVEPSAADQALTAARRAQLDMLGLSDPGSEPLSDRNRPLPYRSTGASVHPTELAARLAAQQGGQPSAPAAQTVRASMWAASAREVAGAPSQVGVQSCSGCGLSLSATARFCRRCGTRQAQPA